MTRASIWFCNVVLTSSSLLLAGAAFAQTPAAPQAPRESGLKRIFSAGLNSLRLVFTSIGGLGSGTDATGAVWRVDVRDGASRRIGNADDLAWPVASPDGLAVFALRKGQIVRIAIGDGSETPVGAPAEWRTLLGVAPDGTVLAVVESDPWPRQAMLGPDGHRIELPPPEEDDERKLIGLLLQNARSYADGVRLEVRDSEHGGRGRDVFLIDGARQRNLSNCGDDLCVQPSRSPDGNYVLFIRASRS
jgi:hypothetical protein